VRNSIRRRRLARGFGNEFEIDRRDRTLGPVRHIVLPIRGREDKDAPRSKQPKECVIALNRQNSMPGWKWDLETASLIELGMSRFKPGEMMNFTRNPKKGTLYYRGVCLCCTRACEQRLEALFWAGSETDHQRSAWAISSGSPVQSYAV
jgi:hypothetical protein